MSGRALCVLALTVAIWVPLLGGAEVRANGSPPATAQQLCASADALAKAGQSAKAEALYVKALEAEASAECASLGLKRLEQSESFWEWAGTAAKDVISVAGFALLAAAAICLFVWIMLQFLTRFPATRRIWPATSLLHPSLEVKVFDDGALETKMGAQLVSLVRVNVAPYKAGAHVVTGHAGVTNVLQPLGEISSEAKAAVSLVSFMVGTLPRPEYEVDGALQPQGAKGRGVSVELTDGGRQVDTMTLWEREFEAPDDDVRAFQALAAPTAAWIDFAIASAEGRQRSLLSSDARSWMLFKAGAKWQEAGDQVRAKALYQEALSRDPENVGAMANLGPLEAQEGHRTRATELLDDALALLEEHSYGVEWRFNPDWYRVKYNRTSLHANFASEEDDAAAKANLPADKEALQDAAIAEREAAHKEASELALATAYLLAWPEGANEDLTELLRDLILPSALVIYAGTCEDLDLDLAGRERPENEKCLWRRLGQAHGLSAGAALRYVTRKPRLTWKVEQDLAFAYTQLSLLVARRNPNAPKVAQAVVAKAREHLRQALASVPAEARAPIAQQLLADPSLASLITDSEVGEELTEAAELSRRVGTRRRASKQSR